MLASANFKTKDESERSVDAEDLLKLVAQLTKYAPHDGTFTLPGSNLIVARSSQVQHERTFSLSRPSLCIVPQGAKSVSLVQGQFEYDASKMVLYAAEIPLKVKITEASVSEPHLCLVIPIDPMALDRLAVRVFPDGVPQTEKPRAVYVSESSPAIIKAAIRLMRVVEEQDSPGLLIPHTIDEIFLRLLSSNIGPQVAQIGILDSHIEKITKAIGWLKGNFSKPLKVEALARLAGMSVSSFHKHFKDVTAMSPLQFQKLLRLQTAREKLRANTSDVTHVAFEVGYTSTSQFSREYSREFGIAPSRESAVRESNLA